MKRFSNPVFISMMVLITLAYVFALSAHAQSVVQQGKTFVEQSANAGGNDTKTDYLYQSKNGEVDTIYLSKTGKAFVWKISKKGNRYKKYLPEIGKRINPTAYEKENDSKRKDDQQSSLRM